MYRDDAEERKIVMKGSAPNKSLGDLEGGNREPKEGIAKRMPKIDSPGRSPKPVALPESKWTGKPGGKPKKVNLNVVVFPGKGGGLVFPQKGLIFGGGLSKRKALNTVLDKLFSNCLPSGVILPCGILPPPHSELVGMARAQFCGSLLAFFPFLMGNHRAAVFPGLWPGHGGRLGFFDPTKSPIANGGVRKSPKRALPLLPIHKGKCKAKIQKSRLWPLNGRKLLLSLPRGKRWGPTRDCPPPRGTSGAIAKEKRLAKRVSCANGRENRQTFQREGIATKPPKHKRMLPIRESARDASAGSSAR